jgi:hypothetical protein
MSNVSGRAFSCSNFSLFKARPIVPLPVVVHVFPILWIQLMGTFWAKAVAKFRLGVVADVDFHLVLFGCQCPIFRILCRNRGKGTMGELCSEGGGLLPK